MKTSIKITLAAAVLAVGGLALAAPSFAHGRGFDGHGGYGSGGYGMGHGGHGMMQGDGPCGPQRASAEPLTVESVTKMMERRLDRWDNDRLKLGQVIEQDGKIVAEIVTVDNSLVEKLEFAKDGGRPQRVK